MTKETPDIVKIAPVIIKDGRYLIVRGIDQDFWKNVGGILEEGETEEECLVREIEEEIDVKVKGKPEYYFSLPITMTVTEPKRSLAIKMYKVGIEGEPNPASEIEELHWLSLSDYKSKKYNLAYQIQDYIVPRLIKDGLIW